jgi:hypothetical protein
MGPTGTVHHVRGPVHGLLSAGKLHLRRRLLPAGYDLPSTPGGDRRTGPLLPGEYEPVRYGVLRRGHEMLRQRDLLPRGLDVLRRDLLPPGQNLLR